MKVFIIGIGGGVGRRVAKLLAANGDEPSGLTRNAQSAAELASTGVRVVSGDLTAMSSADLAVAMRGYDAIVFTAGAGGKDSDGVTTRVDGEGPAKVAEAAIGAGIRRFMLISVFPEAWRARMDASFEHYMVEKKKAEARLVLTDLDWVILRPSALTDEPGTGMIDVGLAKIHTDMTRDDVAATIVELLRRPRANRCILELTRGQTAIDEAISALD